MEEIIEAAKRAQAHDFISELPDGYDTRLGERGLGSFRRSETTDCHSPRHLHRPVDPHSR